MRNTFYITLLGILFSFSVFGQVIPYVKTAHVSECKSNCTRDQRMYTNELSNGFYNLHMQITEACSSYDTILCDLRNDTLSFMLSTSKGVGYNLEYHPKYGKLKKGPKMVNCLCPFDITITIGNVTSMPEAILFEGRIWDGVRFEDLGMHKRNVWKTFWNNSADIKIKELQNLLGKNTTDPSVTKMFSKLGNDSLYEYNMFNTTVSYEEDGIDFVFNEKNLLEEIEFSSEFFLQNQDLKDLGKRSDIEKKIGQPDNEKIDTYYPVDEKGNSYEMPDTWNCYYAKEKLYMRDKLMSPEISFGIALPSVTDNIRQQVLGYINNEQELNRQVFSLLLLKSFVTPLALNNQSGVTAGGAVGANASEMLSNQLSNWLSQLSTNIDVGVNYTPGNALSNEELDLALSTQLFNDKLSIDGNVGVNNNTQTKTSNMIGDLNIDYKLTDEGKVRVKAFNRSNDTYQTTTAGGQFTQGVGVFFREEFETIDELYRRYKQKITKKKKTVKDENTPPNGENANPVNIQQN